MKARAPSSGWVGLIVLALGVVLIAPLAAQDRGTVVVASWGGSFQDAQRQAMFKPFERATGIRVIEATGPTLAKVRAMVASGTTEWDVFSTVAVDLLVMVGQNLVEKVDYGRIDPQVLGDLDPRVIHPFGLGGTWGSKVIAFNTKRYPRGTHPKSWAEFWDAQKFPGPRVIDAGSWIVPPIEYALLADGVPADRLYPLDLERAYRSLTRIKPHVVKWSASPATPTQALVDGEAFLAAAALGRVMRLKEDGAPIDFEWNQGLIQSDFWAIPKGARNYQNALKFLEFVSRPEPPGGAVQGPAPGAGQPARVRVHARGAGAAPPVVPGEPPEAGGAERGLVGADRRLRQEQRRAQQRDVERVEPSALTIGLRGAWEPREYVLRDGAAHALQGLMIFGSTEWSTLFFLGPAGEPVWGVGLGGSYRLDGDRLALTHRYALSTGDPPAGVPPVSRLAARAAADAAVEECRVRVEDDRLSLSFPSGNRMTYRRVSRP